VRRREFIGLLGGTAVTWPLAARAQQPTMPVIGFLSSRSPVESAPVVAGFRQGLKEAGYAEGRNAHIAFRLAETLLEVPISRGRSSGIRSPTISCEYSAKPVARAGPSCIDYSASIRWAANSAQRSDALRRFIEWKSRCLLRLCNVITSGLYCTVPASMSLRANSKAWSAVEVSAEVVKTLQRLSPTRIIEPSERRVDARHFPGFRS
jgi:hypothetical protein